MDKITAGLLCVPTETYSMNPDKSITDKMTFDDDILLKSAFKFSTIKLIGIEDNMPFVTTEKYKLSDFLKN